MVSGIPGANINYLSGVPAFWPAFCLYFLSRGKVLLAKKENKNIVPLFCE
jgi:hypothetical protein